MVKHHRIAAVVSALMLSPMAIPQASAKQTVEVAFVLDTTGSMGPLIEGAKRKIWSIATSIFDANPNAAIRMGLVAYHDIERKELNAKLADLVAKRDAYIVAQRSKQRPKTSSFDQAVAATLKAQIK
jgi:hypothetical protein